MAPKPAGPVEAKAYASLDELHSEFTAAGFDCPGWSPDNGMGLAEESGSCDGNFVLATFANSDDENSAVEGQASATSEGYSVSLVVGPNWFINTWDSEKLAKDVTDYLGGTVRTFAPGSDKDMPDPLAGFGSVDESQAPAGFVKSGDLWVKYGADTSSTYGHTITAEVWTPRYCSSVYLEANLIAEDGTIVGYTNDTLGTMPSASTGQMRLTWTESGANTIRTTRTTCS